MITAKTYVAELRHRNDMPAEQVEAEQTAFVSEMLTRERTTSRVPFHEAISHMDDNGTLGGVKPTREGWRHLCNEIAPGLHSYLKGWENRSLSEEDLRKIQRETFNAALDHRRGDLRQHRVTLAEDERGTVLEAITSPKYQFVGNIDLMQEIPRFLGGDLALSSMSLRGRQFQATLIDPNYRRTMITDRAKEGEVVDLGFQVHNSEDRSMAIGVNISAYLQHCTNGMRSTQALHSATCRHVGGRQNFQRKIARLNPGELTGVIDMVAESSQVRLNDGSMETHTKWVSRKSTKEFASKVVSSDSAYKGYHGKAEYPTVFDVFNAITKEAHSNGDLSVDNRVELESLGYDYINYAMK